MVNFIELINIIIVYSHFVQFLPYDYPFHLWGEFLALVILVFSIVSGYINVYYKDIKILVFLVMPYCFWCFVQWIYYDMNAEYLKPIFVWLLHIACVFEIVKTVKLGNVLKYFQIFAFINCIVTVVWVYFGSLEIINFYSRNIPVITYMGISQSVANLDENMEYEFLRLSGFTNNPNVFAMIAAFGLLSLDYNLTSKRYKIFSVIVFGLVIILTQSRASFAFVSIYFLITMCFNHKKNNVMVRFGLLLLVCFLIMINIYLTFSRGQFTDLNDITSGRDYYMNIVLYLFGNENEITQLLGVGIGTIYQYLDSNIHMKIPLDNSYIPLLLEMGIMGGILCFISLIYLMIYEVYINKGERYKVVALFVAFTAYSFFEWIIFSNRVAMFYELFILYFYGITCDVNKNIADNNTDNI